MTQVGRFRASTFVRCKKKALCAPSVLPGPSEGDHLSPNRGELIPVCVVLLFMKDKESRPPEVTVWTEQKTAAALCTKPVRTNWAIPFRLYVLCYMLSKFWLFSSGKKTEEWGQRIHGWWSQRSPTVMNMPAKLSSVLVVLLENHVCQCTRDFQTEYESPA